MKNDPRAHINIGAIIFPNMDQCDFTGPFEVLARLPDSTFHVVWKRKEPIRDCHGLILTPGTDLAECPKLDLLVVPGGHGQEALMDDEEEAGIQGAFYLSRGEDRGRGIVQG
jgi:cyclohexyl-isocyanide hydratase